MKKIAFIALPLTMALAACGAETEEAVVADPVDAEAVVVDPVDPMAAPADTMATDPMATPMATDTMAPGAMDDTMTGTDTMAPATTPAE